MKFANLAYARAGVAVATLSTLGASIAHADNSVGDNSALNPSGSADFQSGSTNFTDQFKALANSAISTILLIAGVLAVIFLIWSGIQYITSAGNPEKAKTARAGIINAIIGIIVIVGAYFIIRFAVGIGGQLNTTTSG
jgi:hypothetical protein